MLLAQMCPECRPQARADQPRGGRRLATHAQICAIDTPREATTEKNSQTNGNAKVRRACTCAPMCSVPAYTMSMSFAYVCDAPTNASPSTAANANGVAAPREALFSMADSLATPDDGGADSLTGAGGAGCGGDNLLVSRGTGTVTAGGVGAGASAGISVTRESAAASVALLPVTDAVDHSVAVALGRSMGIGVMADGLRLLVVRSSPPSATDGDDTAASSPLPRMRARGSSHAGDTTSMANDAATNIKAATAITHSTNVAADTPANVTGRQAKAPQLTACHSPSGHRVRGREVR